MSPGLNARGRVEWIGKHTESLSFAEAECESITSKAFAEGKL